MTLQTDLRLANLNLRNFRCFSECAVTFHERLNVLVADNGRGKTALLDGLAVALELLLSVLAGSRHPQGFDINDIRLVRVADGMQPLDEVRLEAAGLVGGCEERWSGVRTKHKSRAWTASTLPDSLLATLSGFGEQLRSTASGPDTEPSRLPIVAYYRTGRLANDPSKDRKQQSAPHWDGRMLGYLSFYSPLSSFNDFLSWYQQTHRALRGAPVTGHRLSDRPEVLLGAVGEAVRVVLEPTGWGGLDWDPVQECLVIEHPVQGRLPLGFLSDGVRNMAALVADLAHRCVRLNPQFGVEAARRTSGVLLIDEVDLHLHPGWQQLIVGLLQKAFPNLQMILTTHSPQVLSTVNAESIRVIRLRNGDGQIETPKFQTRGVESADVLAAVMGVDPVPKVEEAQLLIDYRACIEDGEHNTPESQALRARLVEHFGPQHPVILDCDRLIRFTRFKRRSSEGS